MADKLPDDLQDETPEQVRARVAKEGGLPDDLQDEAPAQPSPATDPHAGLRAFLKAGPQPGPESIAPEPYGPAPMDPNSPYGQLLAIQGGQDAFARGGLMGSTLNWAPRAEAGLERLIPRLQLPPGQFFDPRIPTPQARPYGEALKDYRKLYARSEAESPRRYRAGAVVGGAAASAALPGGAASATLQGATAGLGGTDDLSTPEAGRDAIVGGLLGYGGHEIGEAAGEILPRAAGRFRGWLAEGAEGRAVKAATGQNKRVLKQMVERGLSGADTGTVDAVGRDLLDEGVVTAGASTEEIMRRADAAREQAGQRIGQALADLDAITPPGQRISADQLANNAERQLLAPLLTGTHGQQQLAERLAPEIEALRQRGAGQTGEVSFQDLEDFRRGLDESINWAKTEPTPVQASLRRLRGMVNDALEQHATTMSQATGSDAAQRYLDAKRLYGSMATATQAARDNVAGQISNRMISPSDYGVGLSTAAGALANGQGVSSVALGFGAGALNHLGRTRGNQLAAAGLNNLSGSAWLQSVAATQPGLLGKYLGTLGAAAARSPEALGQVHNQLAETDPEYQARMRKLGGQGE